MTRFCARIVLACIGWFVSMGVTHAATLTAVPTATSIEGIGTSVSLAIVIDDLGPGFDPSLSAYDITVTFDDSILQYASTVFGDPDRGGSWLDLDSSGNFQQVTTPTSDSVNLVELSFALPFGRPSPFDAQPSSFTLAVLNFSSVGFGTSAIEFENVVLGDVFANNIFTELVSSSITVTPIPIPAALLFPSALFVLSLLRRRTR